MHGRDDRRLAEEALVDRLRGGEHAASRDRAPAAVVVLDLERATREARDGVERRDHLGQRRVVRRAREAVQRQLVALGDRLPERGARLDEIVEVGAQRERPGRHERDRVEQRGGAPRRSTDRRRPRRGQRRSRRPGRSSRTRRGSSSAAGDRRPERLLAVGRDRADRAASRGIALRLLPPDRETSRKGTVVSASRRARPSTLIAFDRPGRCPTRSGRPDRRSP